MSKLALTIALGATVAGSLGKSFKQSESYVGSLGKKYKATKIEIGKTRSQIGKLNTRIKSNIGDTKAQIQVQKKLQGQLKKSRAEYKKLGASMAKNKLGAGKAMIGKAVGSIGIAGAAMAWPVSEALNYGKAMAKVKALTGATNMQFKSLQQQARKLGKTTRYSAKESADAMGFLAMAGYKTNDIMKTMPGMLDLATAGNLDLAEAADITSNVLSGFGLKAKDTARVSDVIAKAANSSNQSVGMLGEAMKYVAPIANTVGMSVEQTAAMIGKMSDAGIQASQAGTALRAGLLSLNAPSDEASSMLARLGVETRDAEGNMLPMTNILQALGKGMDELGLGNSQKAEAMKKIFGKTASAGMIALMDRAKSGDLQKLTKDLDNSKGSAKKYADIMNEADANFVAFKSVISDLGISIGNVLMPPLNMLLGILNPMISYVSTFIDENKKWIGPLATVAGGIFLVANGLTILKGVMLVAKAATIGLNTAMLANPITWIVGLIVAGAMIIYNYWEPLTQWFSNIWNNPKKAFFDFISFVWSIFKWSPLGIVMQVWGKVFDWLGSKFEWVGKIVKKVKGWFSWGDDDEEDSKEDKPDPAKAAARKTVSRARASSPAVQTARAVRQPTQVNNRTSIKIKAAPGQDTEAVAEAVARRLDERQAQQNRSALWDSAEFAY